jgi:outer membrane protein
MTGRVNRVSRSAVRARLALLGGVLVAAAPGSATAQAAPRPGGGAGVGPGAFEPGVPQPRSTTVPAPLAAGDLWKRLQERVARPGGLTSNEAARRAVATSNEDRSRRADVEVAESEVDRANVGYYPRATLLARYTRLSPITPPELSLGGGQGSLVATPLPAGPLPAGAALIGVAAPSISFPVVLDQYMLQANLTVPLSDYLLRIRQTHDAAVDSREASVASAEAARRTTAAQARLAYYAWARVRLQQAVTEQSVDQAARHLEFARAGHDAGRNPDVDVLRGESLLASAQLLNERTRNAARIAEERLRTTLHDAHGGSYEIGEDLLSAQDAAEAGEPDALYVEALRARPELRAFARTEASLREQRAAAQSAAIPRLDAFGNAYLANPSPRVFPQQAEWRATWDIGVQLAWTPNDLGGASATDRALVARGKKLEAERAAVADALRDEVDGAVIAWREARVAADTAERGLHAAEESYRVRRELFELGRGTDVELIDAENDVLRARLEMIQARVDARVARVRLDHATGRDGR